MSNDLTGDETLNKILLGLRDLGVDSCVGGAIFYGCMSAAQTLQYGLRISAATPLIPQMIGCSTVMGASVLAVTLAPLPRKFFSEKKGFLPEKLESIQIASLSFLGVLFFKLLGGRFFALAPSDLRYLGAFHNKKESLPATLEYAIASERKAIVKAGKTFGCHTCGTRRASAYHGDHMPPKKDAMTRNETFFRKVSGMPVEQRFYPQCRPCSDKQAINVKKNTRTLITHYTSLRSYHATGFLMAFVFGGGLASTTTTHPDNDKEEGKKISHEVFQVVSTKALELFQDPQQDLQYLRIKESELRQQKSQEKNIQSIELIDRKIKEIEKKKIELKAKIKA